MGGSSISDTLEENRKVEKRCIHDSDPLTFREVGHMTEKPLTIPYRVSTICSASFAVYAS